MKFTAKLSIMLSLLAGVCLVPTPVPAEDQYWVVNVQPASILVGLKTGDFQVMLADGRTAGPTTLSTMPNIAAGVGFGLEKMDVEVTAGAGLVINGSFLSYMLNAQGALYFRPSSAPSFTMGPHLGIIYFSAPDWQGNAQASFSGSAGIIGGFHVTLGDRISYLFAVDYIKASYKANFTGAVPPSGGNSLDMDGLAVQFGIHGQF